MWTVLCYFFLKGLMMCLTAARVSRVRGRKVGSGFCAFFPLPAELSYIPFPWVSKIEYYVHMVGVACVAAVAYSFVRFLCSYIESKGRNINLLAQAWKVCISISFTVNAM